MLQHASAVTLPRLDHSVVTARPHRHVLELPGEELTVELLGLVDVARIELHVYEWIPHMLLRFLSEGFRCLGDAVDVLHSKTCAARGHKDEISAGGHRRGRSCFEQPKSPSGDYRAGKTYMLFRCRRRQRRRHTGVGKSSARNGRCGVPPS